MWIDLTDVGEKNSGVPPHGTQSYSSLVLAVSPQNLRIDSYKTNTNFLRKSDPFVYQPPPSPAGATWASGPQSTQIKRLSCRPAAGVHGEPPFWVAPIPPPAPEPLTPPHFEKSGYTPVAAFNNLTYLWVLASDSWPAFSPYLSKLEGENARKRPLRFSFYLLLNTGWTSKCTLFGIYIITYRSRTGQWKCTLLSNIDLYILFEPITWRHGDRTQNKVSRIVKLTLLQISTSCKFTNGKLHVLD